MTSDLGAIVAPAVDLALLTTQWELIDGREARALKEIRLDRGKLLVAARKAFPARGGGWLKHLERWKIEERTAQNYMRLAGYVEASQGEKLSGSGVPTYEEAGIVKKPAAEPAKPEPARARAPRVVKSEAQEAPDDGEPVHEVEAPVALTVVAVAAPPAWADDLRRHVEEMRRLIKAAFSRAEQIEAICVEHEADVTSPILLTARSELVAVKGTVTHLLEKIGGPK